MLSDVIWMLIDVIWMLSGCYLDVIWMLFGVYVVIYDALINKLLNVIWNLASLESGDSMEGYGRLQGRLWKAIGRLLEGYFCRYLRRNR